MKNKIKAGMYLIDDVGITYKVIDVLPHCAIVSAIRDVQGQICCEIMTYDAMEFEKWQLLSKI